MTAAGARGWLAAVIPLVAALEVAAGWRVSRGQPTERDWREAAAWIEARRGERDLVAIAPGWAVQGRVHLGRSITPRDLGRFDTTRYQRLFEVSWRDARAPEARNRPLEDERRCGALTVRRHALPPAAEVRYDLLDNLDRCAAGGGRCPQKRFLVDHHWGTRLVIPVRLSPGPVSLSFEGVPGDGVLHGHAIIGRLDYRTHRLPSGGPVRLSFAFDGADLGLVLVDNSAGPVPFEIALPRTGAGVLRVEVSAADGFERTVGFAADVRKGALERD